MFALQTAARLPVSGPGQDTPRGREDAVVVVVGGAAREQATPASSWGGRPAGSLLGLVGQQLLLLLVWNKKTKGCILSDLFSLSGHLLVYSRLPQLRNDEDGLPAPWGAGGSAGGRRELPPGMLCPVSQSLWRPVHPLLTRPFTTLLISKFNQGAVNTSQVCSNEPTTEPDIIINSNKTPMLPLSPPRGYPNLPEPRPPSQGDAGSPVLPATLLPLVK